MCNQSVTESEFLFRGLKYELDEYNFYFFKTVRMKALDPNWLPLLTQVLKYK